MELKNLFTDVIANRLMTYTETFLKDHGLKADPKDVVDMLVEALEEHAKANRTGNYTVIGMEDEAVDRAILNAVPLIGKWKEYKKAQKEKKTTTEKKETKKTEKTEAKPTRKYTREDIKKQTKDEDEDEFNYEQLELFL